jgi:hypothetical protein
MASFGIGLALLISGFTFYELATLITTPADAGGVLAGPVLKSLVQLTNIPDSIMPYTPYIGLAIMIVGVAWYWVLAPILYLTRPKKD